MLADVTESTIAAEVSKKAIRDRTTGFIKAWKGTTSEQSERQTFWNEFFKIFGLDRRQVAGFEEIAKRSSTGNHGWIDLLYPAHMAVEHKSAGKSLDEAMDQLVDYLPSLHKSVYPWLLVVSDFEHFKWKNLDTGDEGGFPLTDLGKNLHLFWWMAGHGVPHQQFADEEDANLKATALLATLHDRLLDSGYDPHALREWMTRILFCLFADDTEVWDREAFHTWVAKTTRTDGSDLGTNLALLFQVLNTPDGKRAGTLDEDLAALTYINGDLFATTLPIASGDEETRNALLDACKFDWSAISPAIFGSMFQNVMTGVERRSLGAHYTTEENILRTIRPLFLDDLWSELGGATSIPKLQAFHDKLASLTFLDPACGCGNFLVIAYRELRVLETEMLRRLAAKQAAKGHLKGETKGQRSSNLDLLCRVKVDQFYGIEIDEWPARIARTAMYLIDHIANREVSAEFGEHYLRFPIPAAPHIAIENALQLDWNSVLPAEEADYVFGNPPFVGRQFRTEEQKEDLRLAHGDAAGHGVLDYVTGWFVKAADYLTDGSRAAFVATSSISQGQNVSALWPRLLASGVRIDFAHRPFLWRSEARGKAHVQVVIVGFSVVKAPTSTKTKTIYNYPNPKGDPTPKAARRISPYLIDADPLVVETARSALTPVPPAEYGSMSNDGGHLLFDDTDIHLARADPVAVKYLAPYIGGEELINGKQRWCLWLADAPVGELRSSPLIMDRLAKVSAYRSASKREATRKHAGTPALFTEPRKVIQPFLIVPYVSSEKRRYLPLGFASPPVIVRAPSWCIPGADIYLFGILSSAMFMAWVQAVGGRLEGRLQLSPGTIYNPFPFPAPTDQARTRIRLAAQKVLDARSGHNATLGDLYDPLTMPADLTKAHQSLDAAVDAAIAPRHKLNGDADRLAVLFARYEELVAPLQVAASRKTRARASRSPNGT